MIMSVKLVTDSISTDNIRLSTFELTFPASELPKFLMYRQFSRSWWAKGVGNDEVITMTVTATEWQNFFHQEIVRDSKKSPITMLATDMRVALENSKPALLEYNSWHLPYVTSEDVARVYKLATDEATAKVEKEGIESLGLDPVPDTIMKATILSLCLLSAKRCCAKDSDNPEIECYEHQCSPDRMVCFGKGSVTWNNFHKHGNLTGWIQRRKEIVGESMPHNAGVELYAAKQRMRSVTYPPRPENLETPSTNLPKEQCKILTFPTKTRTDNNG